MKMTMVEALAIPRGMSYEEYGKLLADKKRLEAKIRRFSSNIFDEEDSLEVLADEVGSERYNSHLVALQMLQGRRERAEAKLQEIEDKLR
jgi:hypothetical protein